MKHLYTVITRAKANLWIYETSADCELPILTEWINKELIEVVDPNDAKFKPHRSFATAKESTPKQWKLQGDLLRSEMKWKQASLCYRKANRPDLETETEAIALEAEPLLTRQQYHEIAVAYLKADEIAHNTRFLLQAAKNLACGREYLHAAWLYRTLSKVQ